MATLALLLLAPALATAPTGAHEISKGSLVIEFPGRTRPRARTSESRPAMVHDATTGGEHSD